MKSFVFANFVVKKSLPPNLFLKKVSVPYFLSKKVFAPFFSKKVFATPCRWSRPGNPIKFDPSLTGKVNLPSHIFYVLGMAR